MKLIRILYDRKVAADQESIAAIRDAAQEIQDMYKDLAIEIIEPSGAPYSADWLVANANVIVNYNGLQVDADDLLSLLERTMPLCGEAPTACVLFTADCLTMLDVEKVHFLPNREYCIHNRFAVFSTTCTFADGERRDKIGDFLKGWIQHQRRWRF